MSPCRALEWPLPPEHFCCGSLQTPCIVVFIASRQKPIHRGAITQHGKLVFLTIMLYFFGVKNTLKQMCSYSFIKLL